MDPRDEEFHRFVTLSRRTLLGAATVLAAGDRHLAEDLVQTALTKVYLAWPRIRGDAALAYTRRTLVHCFVDQTRRPWWRRERSTAELPERPVDLVDTGSLNDEVADALRDLPPRMRAVLVLRYLFDLDVAETAAHLGCSAATVRSQCARALTRMRGRLDGLPITERQEA